MPSTFNDLLTNGFGVVTVLNVKVYDGPTESDLAAWAAKNPREIIDLVEDEPVLAEVKTLKTSTPTQEGPVKTIMGGLRNSKLIKWGKTARLEMTDALVNMQALQALGGAQLTTGSNTNDKFINLGFGYGGLKTIIGDTVYVDRDTGEEVKVKIIFYSFLPDSIISLTHDAEGDAAIIEFNGDLNGVEITGGNGVFYSIVAFTAPV
jgi:hypothetical protein